MSVNSKFRMGVDVGGTNTDFCIFNINSGELEVYKLPSTLQDQSIAIENGIMQMIDRKGFKTENIETFIHGTTVATNAILENRGARIALITTKGFKDLSEIGRQKRPDLYDLQVDKNPSLISRDIRFEIHERIDHEGKVIQKPDRKEIKSLLEMIKKKQIEGFAIMFLNSYLNSEHEHLVEEMVSEAFPDTYISVSSKVSGQFREYERLMATILNSFVGPEMKNYLHRFQKRLSEMKIKKFYVNQSNGGLISFKEAIEYPINTALSGPAAGVVGAKFLADLKKYKAIISIDIGGTSADISLIQSGELAISKDREIGGYPIRIPALDISTIGAGGGSIAWVDNGGALKVGPKSAGAEPGPACYNRGGNEATITDARVVLGHLNPEALLLGRLPISFDKAVEVVDKTAQKVGMGLHETAHGILEVANSNLVRAIRKITIEKGFNPEEFTLLPFGGAGPLHASELAKELNLSRILIPKNPGILAAFGLLTEDFRKDFTKTKLIDLDKAFLEEISQIFDQLQTNAIKWFDKEGVNSKKQLILKSLDMRYKGQNHEIHINFFSDQIKSTNDLIQLFHREYERLYGYAAQNDIVQVVNFSLVAIGELTLPHIRKEKSERSLSSDAVILERNVYLNPYKSIVCSVYNREKLMPGNEIIGPAIVEQMDTTTIVHEDQMCRVDEFRNLIIEQGQGD
jgi:N-methylhydantoinase A